MTAPSIMVHMSCAALFSLFKAVVGNTNVRLIGVTLSNNLHTSCVELACACHHVSWCEAVAYADTWTVFHDSRLGGVVIAAVCTW